MNKKTLIFSLIATILIIASISLWIVIDSKNEGEVKACFCGNPGTYCTCTPLQLAKYDAIIAEDKYLRAAEGDATDAEVAAAKEEWDAAEAKVKSLES